MKRKTIAVLLGLALGAFALTPTMAQTPDGETPANEGVCDELRADGITKGLYGLCVAFCEAQDHTSLSDPITEEEMDALLDAAPSGKILANYNKKKQAGDPEMPCIKREEPCPCWTEAEFLSTSQLAYDSERNSNLCTFNSRGSVHYIWSGGFNASRFLVYARQIDEFRQCIYEDGLAAVLRNLRVSPEELAACRDRIIARQHELGLMASPTNFRKPYCHDP